MGKRSLAGNPSLYKSPITAKKAPRTPPMTGTTPAAAPLELLELELLEVEEAVLDESEPVAELPLAEVAVLVSTYLVLAAAASELSWA